MFVLLSFLSLLLKCVKQRVNTQRRRVKERELASPPLLPQTRATEKSERVKEREREKEKEGEKL